MVWRKDAAPTQHAGGVTIIKDLSNSRRMDMVKGLQQMIGGNGGRRGGGANSVNNFVQPPA